MKPDKITFEIGRSLKGNVIKLSYEKSGWTLTGPSIETVTGLTDECLLAMAEAVSKKQQILALK